MPALLHGCYYNGTVTGGYTLWLVSFVIKQVCWEARFCQNLDGMVYQFEHETHPEKLVTNATREKG
jgi:hypothetical protein